MAGSVALLLRDRGATAQERRNWGTCLSEARKRHGQLLVVADRIDLALALEADGVHLGHRAVLPTAVLRLGAFRWISVAHHGFDDLPGEERAKVGAVLVSPILAERKGRPPLGLPGFEQRAAHLRDLCPQLRVGALGGVTGAHVASCRTAGADFVAVMGGLLDPTERRHLLQALGILRA